jgi:hypothetical protein
MTGNSTVNMAAENSGDPPGVLQSLAQSRHEMPGLKVDRVLDIARQSEEVPLLVVELGMISWARAAAKARSRQLILFPFIARRVPND